MNADKLQMHKGMDIRCKGDAVLATENNGKVVAVNQNAKTAGGKSVTIEYERADGSKIQNTYMHLSSVDVKVGDKVQTGRKSVFQATPVHGLRANTCISEWHRLPLTDKSETLTPQSIWQTSPKGKHQTASLA